MFIGTREDELEGKSVEESLSFVLFEPPMNIPAIAPQWHAGTL